MQAMEGPGMIGNLCYLPITALQDRNLLATKEVLTETVTVNKNVYNRRQPARDRKLTTVKHPLVLILLPVTTVVILKKLFPNGDLFTAIPSQMGHVSIKALTRSVLSTFPMLTFRVKTMLSQEY